MIFFLINLILFLLGTFMNMTSTILICTPIFLPITMQFGMDPVQFGMVVLINCALGLKAAPLADGLRDQYETLALVGFAG